MGPGACHGGLICTGCSCIKGKGTGLSFCIRSLQPSHICKQSPGCLSKRSPYQNQDIKGFHSTRWTRNSGVGCLIPRTMRLVQQHIKLTNFQKSVVIQPRDEIHRCIIINCRFVTVCTSDKMCTELTFSVLKDWNSLLALKETKKLPNISWIWPFITRLLKSTFWWC
jgi:hypothetical protein